MKFFTHYISPLGEIVLTSDGKSLTGLCFTEQDEVNQKNFPHIENDEIPVFKETKRWLDEYFSFTVPTFSPSFVLNGTEFQKEVWSLLLEVPYGKTITYGEIANCIAIKRGDKKMSAQAVGQAVGHNPIALIVPCHRVVGKDGKMTGYAYGIERKIKLLTLEKRQAKEDKFNA